MYTTSGTSRVAMVTLTHYGKTIDPPLATQD
jgi:hypothetical protein